MIIQTLNIYTSYPFCRQSRNPVKQLAARTDLKDTYFEMSAAIAFADATEEKEITPAVATKRVERGKKTHTRAKENILFPFKNYWVTHRNRSIF